MKRKIHMAADEVEVGMQAHHPGWVSARDRVGLVTQVETNERKMTRLWIEGASQPWYGHSDEIITVVP